MSRYISQSEARKINLANQRPKKLKIQNFDQSEANAITTWWHVMRKNEKIEKISILTNLNEIGLFNR